MTAGIDTLKAAEILEGAGFEGPQAKAMVEALAPDSHGIVSRDYLDAQLQALEGRLAARIYGGQIAAVVAVVGALKFFGLF